MAENNEVIGIQFGTQGLGQVQSDLRTYQSSLQKVADFQNKFAQRTMEAAQAQARAAQSSKSAYESQIRDAQRAYEAKVVEAREFARATREKIANYRLEATAAENGLRAQIATLKARERAEGTSASVAAILNKTRVQAEIQLAQQRRQTENQVEAMRLKERQSLDKITAEADKLLTKRRQLEDGLRKEAAANQQNTTATKANQQAIEAATKAVNERIKAVDKQIRGAEKVAVAQQKAFNKSAINAQKDALKQSEEQAKRSAAAYAKFTDVVGTLNPRMGFLAKSAGNLSGKMLVVSATIAATLAVVLAFSAGVLSLGKSMYGMGVQGNFALETIATFSNVVNSALRGMDEGGGAGNVLGGLPDSFKEAEGGARSLGVAIGEVKQQLTQNVSMQYLDELRQKTRGTISDTELMRLTLQALQGTTLEFRAVVAPALGDIADATGRIGRAMGLSADVIREKFIFGLRRQENRLLDDIGVKVDAVKANELYAASIGKTVEALTQQERQIAFTQEAVKQLKVAAGELGDPNTTVENVARIQASIENIRLRIRLALAPFADVVSGALAGIVQLGTTFINYIAPAIKVVSENFKGLAGDLNKAGINFAAIQPIVTLSAKIFLVFLSVLNAIITGIRRMVGIVKAVPSAFNNAFGGIPGIIGGVFKQIKFISELGIEQLAYLMAYGGGAVIGAFAEGLYMGIKPVVQAVTAVANVVADFLMGFSPPRKGPLHTIDKGAIKVGEAWVNGFMRGLLDFEKRSDVLGFVNERLGDIGKFNMKQVEAGLLRLDIALRPYQERLEIVTADMEALTGFIDPALDALDRIQSRSIRALKQGGGDVEALRALDRQILSLQRIQDLRQDSIDQATVQMAMAQSHQIQERTLLLIQQRRLKMLEDGKDAADKGNKGGADGAGGGSGAPDTEGDMGSLPIGALPPPEDFLGDFQLPDVSDDIFAGLTAGFFDVTSIDNDVSAFKKAMGRIDEANPGQKTAEKLTGLVQAFTDIQAPIATTLSSIFSTEEGGLLGTALLNLGTFNTASAANLLTTWGAEDSTLTSVKENIASFVAGASENFGQLTKDITGDGGFTNQMDQSLSYLFGPTDNVDNVLGLAKDNLDKFIDGGKTSFQSFIDFLKGDFQLGPTLDQMILAPIRGLMYMIAQAAESGILAVVKGINDVLNEIPEFVRNNIGLSKLDIEPGFITGLLGFEAAKGALGARGLGLVGEHGPELIAPSRGVDVFPANATQAIIRMSQMMARNPGSQVIVLPGRGGGSNATTNTFAPTFNMQGSRDNSMLRARQLYASMVR